MMAIATGREIRDGELAIFGVRLSMLAGYFAQAHHAPRVRAMTEGGVYGATPVGGLPWGIECNRLAVNAVSFTSALDALGCLVASGRCVVGIIGAFIGMIAFSKAAHRFGRKPVFVVAFLAAMAATIFFYLCFDERADIWMSLVLGICQLSLFAGFAIYLPELFPTRLRSTGTSFCYNVGRFIAASGPITLGALNKSLSDKAILALPTGYTDAMKNAAELAAFRSAGCYMSAVFLLGIVALMFLPETKDRPMPEG
ncbi:MAG TPA: MFS transporter [Prosthecobacter sp.]|nr:MFS transporter [Prosthecobacter sp.]